MNNAYPLRLRKRAEFLAARSGKKIRSRFFLLEKRQRNCDEVFDAKQPARVGFTVTRKNGNAVVRNRIRRRLREAVRVGLKNDISSGIDYVIVARRNCLHIPFNQLVDELKHVMSAQNKIAQEKNSKRDTVNGI